MLVRKHEGRRGQEPSLTSTGMPVVTDHCRDRGKICQNRGAFSRLRQKPSMCRRKARKPPWPSLGKTTPLLEETEQTPSAAGDGTENPWVSGP